MKMLAAILALAASGPVTTGMPASQTAANPPCQYPSAAVADYWGTIAHPSGATEPVSVQQADQDACLVLAADSTGKRWISTNAGDTWTPILNGPPITRLLTERLQPRAGLQTIGPVLGVGPPAGDPTGLPQVYVSGDGGLTWEAAQVHVAVDTLLGAADQLVPLRMSVSAATTAVHYEGGQAQAYVYVAGHAANSLLPALPVGDVAALLKSTDGGHTFTAVRGAAQLSPTAIAVNPTSQEEIWVNDVKPGGDGGGAWVSYDGGANFQPGCTCTDLAVHDIAIGGLPDGGIAVLLATDGGVRRSVDDGASWDTIGPEGVTSVRTAPDDAMTLVVATADGVSVLTGGDVKNKLPCATTGLRRDDDVPPTFLVECPENHRTYRLLLTRYAGRYKQGKQWTITWPVSGLPANARPLPELATWRLPDSNTATGTIAFDGSVLYYDLNTPGDIGRVRASDGTVLPPWHTEYTVASLTVDLRRNALIVSTPAGEFVAIDIDTQQTRDLGLPPTRVSSYDSSIDGLTWVPEVSNSLYHRALKGTGPGTIACSYVRDYYDTNWSSTFVASGDGGGYIQLEDDSTLVRIDKNCAEKGKFSHRPYSEASAENDAMACDTWSYFPQPAIWIRDSQPQTVSAYGVPFGYCPMPSELSARIPNAVYAGSLTSLCAVLVNATNGKPASDRPVTMWVAGAVVGHGKTDDTGLACVQYIPTGGFVGKRVLPFLATFAGDSALYPSQAKATLTVLDAAPVPPPPIHPVVVVPPPPPPPVPAVPPNPMPNPGPNAGQAQEAAQAQAGQMQAQQQPVANGVLVPQRQQQPQLALAQAAERIGLENNAMVAPARRRRSLPSGGPAALVTLAAGCLVTALAARTAPARRRR